MKKLSVGIALSIAGLMTLKAQVQIPIANASQTVALEPSAYQVTRQDGNSSIWQQESYVQLPDGQTVTNIHKYTELATGLNHLVNDQWVESKEEINLLPDGTAEAVNGQHQAYFPGDIYNGKIKLVTSDGTILQSQPVGLSYDDGKNTVLIAVLTNSVGQLVGSNQIVYPNAFVGVNADLRYTYTKAGFEQDVVLQSQLPDAASLGLNPDTVQLQVMTEFFDPPQPKIKVSAIRTQAGLTMTDETLGFGTMEMIQGRAYSLGQGDNDSKTLVSKKWGDYDGRKILVEAVPVMALADELLKLPAAANSTKANSRSPLNVVSAKRLLPDQRLVKADTNTLELAKADFKANSGIVLDYQTVNSSVTNFTFRGDTTYYISGNVNSFGTNTFEGGTVIKCGASLIVNGLTVCSTSPYRMAYFTSTNDNSIGDIILGSTGSPATNSFVYLQINATNIVNLSYLRFAYAGTAIFENESGSNVDPIWNSQFVKCKQAIEYWYNISLYNVLFAGCSYDIYPIYGGTVTSENVTADANFSEGSNTTLYMTNCIVPNGASATTVYANNNFTEFNTYTTGFTVASPWPPYQTVGAGNYYLTNTSNCHGGGTTNINSVLLAELATKTTQAPLVYSNITVSVPTTLSQQAQRDTATNIDVGYHYDPIDYLVDTFTVTNALLTINSGTVIAADNATAGIWLQDGSSISSVGTATSPNWFVHYSCVQEQPLAFGSATYLNIFINSYHYGNTGPNGLYQFSKFAVPSDSGAYAFYSGTTWVYDNLFIQDCELWNCESELDGAVACQAVLNNNLFHYSSFEAVSLTSITNYTLSISNGLFYNTTFYIYSGINSNQWTFFNNDFDTCLIRLGKYGNSMNGYNAYVNCTNRLVPNSAYDLILTNALNYQSSWFGDYYQPTNSPLIDKGSTTADQAGLYSFTVLTNQTPELNSTVDIGYHYLAADVWGNPLFPVPPYLGPVWFQGGPSQNNANYILNGVSYSAGDGGPCYYVCATAVDASGRVYYGGDFTYAGPTSAEYNAQYAEYINTNIFPNNGYASAEHIAMWDPNAPGWTPLMESNMPTLGNGVYDSYESGVGYGRVNSILIGSDNNVYVGGMFDLGAGPTGSQPVHAIAVWNPSNYTWSSLGSGSTNGLIASITDGFVYGGVVNGMVQIGSRIYVVGGFKIAGNIGATNIAAWDMNSKTWVNVGAPPFSFLGTGEYPTCIATDGTNVYVGGQGAGFSPGATESYAGVGFACGTLSGGTINWETITNNISSGVNAIAVTADGRVFAAGAFYDYPWSGSERYLVEFNNANNTFINPTNVPLGPIADLWSPPGHGADYPFNGTVYSLAVLTNNLSGIGSNSIVSTNMPSTNAPSSLSADMLVLGGSFNFQYPVSGPNFYVHSVVGYNITSGNFFTLGESNNTGIYGQVWALAAASNSIYAGGEFWAANSVANVTTNIGNVAGLNVYTNIWFPLK